jgi:beta-galactosidase
MVYLATRERLRRCGTGNGTVAQDVKVYSNLSGVELFHDGNSLGLKRPDDVKSAVWKVPFRDGWNELEARGMHEGKELRDVVRVHFTLYPEKLSDPAVPFREIAVNCGAYVDYADPEGLIWQADRPYREGGWGYVGGIDNWQAIPKVYRKGVSGTEEDPLYQTPREGVEAYRFDVPDGDYEVELRMTEYFEENGPGARVFRVKQGDKVLIHSIDLAKENGVLQAVSKTVHPRVKGGKGLSLTFEALAGKTTISGIRVRKLR